jgi:hypothetical protein
MASIRASIAAGDFPRLVRDERARRAGSTGQDEGAIGDTRGDTGDA